MLKEYLEKYPFRLTHKLLHKHADSGVAFEPMRNYLDVSVGWTLALHSTP